MFKTGRIIFLYYIAALSFYFSVVYLQRLTFLLYFLLFLLLPLITVSVVAINYYHFI